MLRGLFRFDYNIVNVNSSPAVQIFHCYSGKALPEQLPEILYLLPLTTAATLSQTLTAVRN